mmetsp:Transcript_47187/g.112103  ORF Transcript_47187/g.112103 Transcript_47187/m.112103 type:complete len:297 (-) Transcript_47187:33-923(-)
MSATGQPFQEGHAMKQKVLLGGILHARFFGAGADEDEGPACSRRCFHRPAPCRLDYAARQALRHTLSVQKHRRRSQSSRAEPNLLSALFVEPLLQRPLSRGCAGCDWRSRCGGRRSRQELSDRSPNPFHCWWQRLCLAAMTQYHVCVGAAYAKRAHSRQSAIELHGFGCQQKRGPAPVHLLRRSVCEQAWNQHLPVQHHNCLDEARDSCDRVQVPHIALDGAQVYAALLLQHLRQCMNFQGVSDLRSGSMPFHVVKLRAFLQGSISMCPGDALHLTLVAGRREVGLAGAVVVHRSS